MGSAGLWKLGHVFLLPLSRGQQEVEMSHVLFSGVYQKIRFFLDITKSTYREKKKNTKLSKLAAT